MSFSHLRHATSWLKSGSGLLQNFQRRGLYWILYNAANKLDPDRIKLVGPDRACAEWLVKCGAQVKFHGGNTVYNDYNQLGMTSGRKLKLAEAEVEEATITSIGFAHFEGVEQIRRLSFKKCAYFDDSCIAHLVNHVGSSLEELQIISCGITDRGLKNISNFRLLTSLTLFELPEVKQKTAAFNELASSLPGCVIKFTDHNDFFMSND